MPKRATLFSTIYIKSTFNILFGPPLFLKQQKRENNSREKLARISERFRVINALRLQLFIYAHHGSEEVHLFEIFFWIKEDILVVEVRDGRKRDIIYRGTSIKKGSLEAKETLLLAQKEGFIGDVPSARSIEKTLLKKIDKLA